MSPTPPSSLGLDRSASAARTGRQELKERYEKHNETSPALTGGDVDADWESAYSVGDETPGGDNPTPDQNVVDDIGRRGRQRVSGQRRARGRRQDRRARSAPLGVRSSIVGGLRGSLKDPFPRFQPASRAGWRAWLQKHHASAPGVLLVYAKKHTGLSSLDWDEAVEEALCFGWIDSKRQRLDDTFFLQIFTPRKPKSRWSALNKKRVAALTKAGLMTPAGLAAIDLAKKTGTWSAFDHVDAMVMPPDLKTALAKAPAAAAKFKTLTAARQKQFLYFMNDAKKEETRIKRIAHILKALS